MAKGVFTVSLDFELYWGVRDKRTIESYGANLLGVRQAIPRMLDAFSAAGVHATWATVGFLFFDDKDELLAHLPQELPTYSKAGLSPYPWLEQVGPNERKDPYHFGLSLIRQIMAHPGQEVASHTFSHYYCLEDGQTQGQFRADLAAAKAAAGRLGLTLRSLVFPRNQFNASYLAACREAGFVAFRGNEPAWIYRAERNEDETSVKRLGRLIDTYVPLTGYNSRPLAHDRAPLDVPSSRFLRPYSPKLAALDPLRLERIKAEMTHAAQRGLVYHLWWHPHNFGAHTDENMQFLQQVLDHYRLLADRHGMQGLSIGEVADLPLERSARAA
ncbi:MAG TPA: polysaccharide deacetylase family protein [Caulobacteraceae bacterium]|nr:polysaccharide deacetylase family protein [Caulobacteraceae bacterium]